MRGKSYEGTKPAGGDDTGGNPSEGRVALVIGNGAYQQERAFSKPGQ